MATESEMSGEQYNLKPGQLAEIEWVDPAAASHWVDAGTVTECVKFTCRSVGFVHAMDDYGVVLVASCGEDADGDRSLLLRQHLPWVCITGVHVWVQA